MKQIRVGIACLLIIIASGQTNFTQQACKPDFRHVPSGGPNVAPREIEISGSLSEVAAISQQPERQLRSNAPRRRLVDGTSQLKARDEERGARVQPGLSQPTIPYWSDNFSYQGLDFTYKMVGTDPQKGSRTTVIPTEIIPFRFVFQMVEFLMQAPTW